MTRKFINIKDVKIRARGRWDEIFPALASALEPALKRKGHHVPCPVHGGEDGFRLIKDEQYGASDGTGICSSCKEFKASGGGEAPLDGFGIIAWVNSWSFREALERVDEFLNDNNYHATDTQPTSQATKKHYSSNEKKIYAQLNSASQKPNNAHIHYFENRGIEKATQFKSESILFSGGIYCSKNTKTPAIIGRMTNNKGDLLGLHQIYLTQDGKKLTELSDGRKADAKRLLKLNEETSLRGGAIRFGDEYAKVMAVGEGLETMLAVRLMCIKNKPALRVLFAATCTAGLLTAIEVPEHIETLVIYADKDKNGAGENAASALYERERYERKVVIRLPDMPIPDNKKGVDWLDVYTLINNK